MNNEPAPAPGGSASVSRLALLAFTPAHLRALLIGEAQFENDFQIRVAHGVSDFIRAASPEFAARIRSAIGMDPWRDGFGVLLSSDGLMIGTCGFTAPPDEDGAVEIGYGIAPDFEGKGYATEAARLLIAHAFGTGQVRKITAHTLPGPNASTRLLEKCEFRRAGESLDPEHGAVWRWELTAQKT